MKINLNKILTAFDSARGKEHMQEDNHTEDIINAIDETPFAVSEQNVLFARTSELGGYYYVITIFVGPFKIKTNKGAKLTIEGNNFDLILNSDTDEFESDRSKVLNKFITRIDFQIEKEDVSKFDKEIIKTLKLSAKKQEVIFNTL